MVSCQALTLFGFLWVSFPCEFCLEAESFSGALNTKPNSAPSNHFPLVCFSASFIAFPWGQTHRLTWTGPKDSWPQLITLKTQDYERGVPELCDLTGKKSPSSPWLSPCSPLSNSAWEQEVNQRLTGDLQRCLMAFLWLGMAAISLGAFSHHRELLPNSNNRTALRTKHGCQPSQPGHCVAILLLHVRKETTVLPGFHMNRTKCLAKPCKNMYIKLSPCSQGCDVSFLSLLLSFWKLHWGPALPDHKLHQGG